MMTNCTACASQRSAQGMSTGFASKPNQQINSQVLLKAYEKLSDYTALTEMENFELKNQNKELQNALMKQATAPENCAKELDLVG